MCGARDINKTSRTHNIGLSCNPPSNYAQTPHLWPLASILNTMAPLDPDATAQSNAKPIAVFSAQILLVIAASTKVLLTAQRGARALPPPTSTRAQRPVRRRHVILFSALAFLSLSSVTFFAVIWRVLSYLEWAETGNHQTPGSLWTGWYGTGEKGVGRWRLGDWMSDKDLVRESDAMAVSKFEVTSQHFVGLLANSLFIGIEGRSLLDRQSAGRIGVNKSAN